MKWKLTDTSGLRRSPQDKERIVESRINQGERLLRLPEVLKRIPVSKSHWWDGIKRGHYPRGLKLSSRCTAWKASDIDALIDRLSEDSGSRTKL